MSSSSAATAQESGEAHVREILRTARSIAVVGAKSDAREDAHRIPAYMADNGYRVLAVNPKVQSLFGLDAVPNLDALSEPVDLVNLFRATEHIPGHVDEILAMSPRPKAVWMQLGVYHGPSAARLRAAGIAVIEDACIMVEHKRLLA